MKKTVKTYVVYIAPRYKGAQADIALYTFDPRKMASDTFSRDVVVSERDIEIEVPDDFDPRPDMIANLQAEEKKARADFAAKVASIKRQISELQAIEFAA